MLHYTAAILASISFAIVDDGDDDTDNHINDEENISNDIPKDFLWAWTCGYL